MHPAKHIVLTILLWFVINLFHPLNVNILILSISATLLVDIDHLLGITFMENDLNTKVRILIKKKKFFKAFRFYYTNRKTHVEHLYVHNTLVVIILTLVTLYLKSLVLFIGVVFHFMCDIAEDFFTGDLSFWTRSWEKSNGTFI